MNNFKHILIVFLAVISTSVFAQQDAHYTNFMFNKLVINPAAAGSEDILSSSFFHRTQWTKFSGNPVAPVTQTFSTHTPLGKQPIGAGINIVNDKIGFQKNLNLTLSGSYFINLRSSSFYGRDKKRLYMGMQAGFRQYSLDVNALDPHEQGDLVIPTIAKSTMLPEIGVGFLYTSEGFYAGVSVPHLVQSKIKYSDYQGIEARQVRHYYVMSGYEYELTSEFTLKPNVIMKYAVNAPIEFDVNALVEYDKMVWSGFSVRTRDAVAFLVGVNAGELSSSFNEQIKIGYSFDWSVSRLPQYNKGSHEIYIIYNINLGEKTLRPKFVG